MDFEDYFNDVLKDRTNVGDSINEFINSNSDIDIKLSYSTFTTVGDDDDDDDVEYTEEDERPGYVINLEYTGVSNDYKYRLFEITLPKDDEFPVELKFFTLKRKKKCFICDASSLDRYLSDVLVSNEYNEIVNRLKSLIK